MDLDKESVPALGLPRTAADADVADVEVAVAAPSTRGIAAVVAAVAVVVAAVAVVVAVVAAVVALASTAVAPTAATEQVAPEVADASARPAGSG